MTTVTLPEDIEAWARAEVAAGRAASVEALVADAVRWRREQTEALRAEKLDQARASIARGEEVAGEALMEGMRKRVAELRALAAAE